MIGTLAPSCDSEEPSTRPGIIFDGVKNNFTLLFADQPSVFVLTMDGNWVPENSRSASQEPTNLFSRKLAAPFLPLDRPNGPIRTKTQIEQTAVESADSVLVGMKLDAKSANSGILVFRPTQLVPEMLTTFGKRSTDLCRCRLGKKCSH
jgi:hypothetical protein